MRRYMLMLLPLFCSVHLLGQQRTFSYTDSVFYEGSVKELFIYFSTSHRPDGEIEKLDSLGNMLLLHPEIDVVIESHSDCRGSAKYNLKLCQKRAETLVHYVQTEFHLNEERISAKGYGEEALLVHCACQECTEEEHQQNRRTLVRVIRK